MIRHCSCLSNYQDQRYGPAMRVHNPARGRNGGIIPRCTVCLSEKGEEDKKDARPKRA